jgi:hypothetical protein
MRCVSLRAPLHEVPLSLAVPCQPCTWEVQLAHDPWYFGSARVFVALCPEV